MLIYRSRALFQQQDKSIREGPQIGIKHAQQKQLRMDPVVQCLSNQAVRKICAPSGYKRKHDTLPVVALHRLFQTQYFYMDEMDE